MVLRMGLGTVFCVMCLPASVATSLAQSVSPMQKVLQLLTELQAKIVQEGEEAQKTFAEFTQWCEDRNANLGFEIKTGKAKVATLQAAIDKATSEISSLSAAIEENAAKLATGEADLKAATAIRQQEETDFSAEERELMEVVDMLNRAIGILERELRKGATSALQLPKIANLVQAFQAMVDASMLNSQDAAKLTALFQQSQAESDSDGFDQAPSGAPAAAAYQSKSGGIIETLQSLLDKAEEQLETARKEETNAKHHFEMLQQSIQDEIKFASADMDEDKKNLALQTEAKASAEGDLKLTKDELVEDEATQGSLHQDCFTESQDFESAVQSRAEELKALAAAKKVLQEMAGGAQDLAYGTSFLQVGYHHEMSGGLRNAADLANYEAVRLVRNLARQYHSQALAQLSQRMASVMELGGTSGDDPFAKVKQLIRDMITTLEKDASADANHKAYCDKEMGETDAKKIQKEAELDKLSTQIDSKTSKSAEAKEEIAATRAALAELAKAEAELTMIRNQEKAEYQANKPEMEQGLEAVKMALKVLREYYAQEGKAHQAAEGAGGGIIGLLEVIESDFTKLLAEMTVEENTAAAEYEKTTRANTIDRATKERSVEHLSREVTRLDAEIAEETGDRDGVHNELQAVLEYKAKITEMCVAKPESYTERKGRREAEIAGLKEALKILQGEAVLLQHGGRKRGFLHRALEPHP